eukprot:8530724-Pyramimonas_sp.AAC.1
MAEHGRVVQRRVAAAVRHQKEIQKEIPSRLELYPVPERFTAFRCKFSLVACLIWPWMNSNSHPCSRPCPRFHFRHYQRILFPSRRSKLATSEWPRAHARMSGVSPPPPRAGRLTSAPDASSAATTRTRP